MTNQHLVSFINCLALIFIENGIIIPCTADGSSARAIDNVAKLLYGIDTPKGYSKTNFHQRAIDNGLALPNIHSVVLNRSTMSSDKPASAFEAMYNKIKERVTSLQQKKPAVFTPRINHFITMPDAHTVSIVASYYALPLDKISPKPYDLENETGKKTMINEAPLNRYKESLSTIVQTL